MSGPHGIGPEQPWQPPGQGEGQRSGDRTGPRSASPWQQPAQSTRSATWQAPAYTRPPSTRSISSRPSPRYPQQYPQPAAAGYAQPGQYGAARAIRPAGPVRPAGRSTVSRVSMASRASTASPAKPGQYGQYPASTRQPFEQPKKRSTGLIGGIVGGIAAAPRRGHPGAGLLAARVLCHHQAGRQQGPGRRAADPHRRDQRLRREERQRRQVQQRPESRPSRRAARFDCDVSIDGAPKHGDRDVPGQQGHLRGRSAQQ